MAVDWMKSLRTEIKHKPTAGVIHGMPGVGKTSLAAAAPAPLFITGPYDVGVETLKATGQLAGDIPNLPPCTSLADVYSQLQWVAEADHKRKTLVIDNLGDIEGLMAAEVLRRDFKGDQEKASAFEVANRVNMPAETRNLLSAIDRVRDAGLSVLLIAHTKAQEIKDPTSANYDKWLPDLSKYCWPLFARWADLILFCSAVTHVVGSNAEATKKGKARGGQERRMYCSNAAAYEAKNRHNLPDYLPMGNSGAEAWGNLITAIKEGRN